MNPGEWLGIEIYTAAADETSPKAPADPVEKYKVLSSEVTWSCHVAGVECPAHYDLDIDFDYLGLNEPSFLQVSINHQGWGVYFILFFTVVRLILQVLLAKSAGLHKSAPVIQLFLFSIAIALSMAASEVASDWLITDRVFGVELDFGQPIYAYILFWVNAAVIVLLAVISIWRRSRKMSRLRPARRFDEDNEDN
jgi:hypothetical protein